MVSIQYRAEPASDPPVSRRKFLAGFTAALGMAALPNKTSAQNFLHSIPRPPAASPLLGIPRIPMRLPTSNFPGNFSPYTGSVFGGPFGLGAGMGRFGYRLPYFIGNNYPNSRRNVYRNHNLPNQSSSCYRSQSESVSKESPHIMESTIEYLEPKTEAEKVALESLRVNVLNSLVSKFGYYPIQDRGQVINQVQDLRQFLIPVMLAHDIYNKETLEAIEQGLKNRNPQLMETYGSAKFFQDTLAVIEFHKVKAEAQELLKKKDTISDPAIADLNRITGELKEIQQSTRARLTKETRTESTFSIGQPEEHAAFIVCAYHSFSDDKLAMIVDALAKTVDPKKVTELTLEQRLYTEQFTTAGTTEIGKYMFLRLIQVLNDDKDSNGNKRPKKIPELIKKAA